MTPPKPSMSCNKLVRCRKCYRLLCKRVPIHLDSDETYIVHIKHRGLELWAFDCTINCTACGASHRVNGAEGIIATEQSNAK